MPRLPTVSRSMRSRVSSGWREAANKTLDALLISVANSDQYGNQAKIAPHARVDDGVLDLVAVRPTGVAGAAILGAQLFLGSIDRNPPPRAPKHGWPPT